jgi:hypothetical protein
MDLTNIDHDFTDDEIYKIKTYTQNGMIGLESVVSDETKLHNMFSLYMAGRGYGHIASAVGVKKDIVLYLAAKLRWYEKRIEHINNIQRNVANKIAETKIKSVDFITDLINFHHKYYGESIDKFMLTGDKTIVEDIDMKFLTQYFKSIEVLEKLVNPANVKQSTNITIKGDSDVKIDKDSIEISSSTSTGKMLEMLAEIKNKQKSE